MKKYIMSLFAAALLFLIFDALYYRAGWYIDFSPRQEVSTFVKAEGEKIYMDSGSGYAPFEIKGVNLGSGKPGSWSTDYAIDKETYLRWFSEIQQMGANTIRVYSIQEDVFYNAFYAYNKDNPTPLYLLHGVWVNDYVQNSHRDAWAFYDDFLDDCKTMLDVIHGNKKLSLGRMASAGHGAYRKDISPWVIGYILGVEWEDVTVAYTDDTYRGREGYDTYTGTYMATTEDATPFEALLCQVGDQVVAYESKRYKTQKLLAFSNWPTTDPFEYPENVTDYFLKCASVDVEHIRATPEFLSGQFASYHVYPYYPDYLNYVSDWDALGEANHVAIPVKQTPDGKINSYRAYLRMLTAHHTIPVVISEFGVSTGRSMAQEDSNTGRNQGNLSEREQGQALVECYRDIMAVGCAGGCVFSWQDEWFKRTWNTMYAVDLTRTPYWSDYQTNEQYFGLLSFDPGKEKSVCYVDGDIAEWSEDDLVCQNGTLSLSMKYDEKFLYFMIHKPGLDFDTEKLYIPIDVTPKSGAAYCENFDLRFDRPVDFVISLDGREHSRLLVHERYEALRAMYSENAYGFNTYFPEHIPAPDSPKFVPIHLMLQVAPAFSYSRPSSLSKTYETGALRYGNANPESPDFNCLADFIVNGDNVELKLPWQLLNFADPSRMKIHDDYYDGNYGIELISIRELYAGITQDATCALSPLALKGWGNKVSYHERLKDAYYLMQQLWNAPQSPDLTKER